jgi:copper chaperone
MNPAAAGHQGDEPMAIRETILQVDGMSCASCVRHVNEALRPIAGVETVQVRLKERRVFVRHRDDVRPEVLVEALRDAGYDAFATDRAPAWLRDLMG